MQRLERVGVIRTNQAALLCERLLERLARWRVLAALEVDEAEHLLQLRSHHGSAAQLREGAVLGACEELANGHAIAVRSDCRIRGLEQVDQNPHDLFRLVALEPGDATLLSECSCLQRGDDAEGRNTRDEHGSRRDGEAIPTHELARPVAHGVGLGEHGVPTQEPFDLFTQLTRRRVAALGLLAQRGQDNAIEVAANPSAQLASIGDVRRRLGGW